VIIETDFPNDQEAKEYVHRLNGKVKYEGTAAWFVELPHSECYALPLRPLDVVTLGMAYCSFLNNHFEDAIGLTNPKRIGNEAFRSLHEAYGREDMAKRGSQVYHYCDILVAWCKERGLIIDSGGLMASDPPIINLHLDNTEIDNRDTETTELHSQGYRIEVSMDLVREILRNAKENAEVSEVKTYVIVHDEYMGVSMTMYEEKKTWRQLLFDLNGVELDNLEEPIDDDVPEFKGRKVKDLTDEELEKFFHEANGNGQPFYTVWCVEDRKRVL